MSSFYPIAQMFLVFDRQNYIIRIYVFISSAKCPLSNQLHVAAGIVPNGKGGGGLQGAGERAGAGSREQECSKERARLTRARLYLGGCEWHRSLLGH